MRSDDRWSQPLDLGAWASGATDIKRGSVRNEDASGPWRVETDTVRSEGAGVYAEAYRYELDLISLDPSLAPIVGEISVLVSDSSHHGEVSEEYEPAGEARGKALPVPARSQMVYPDGGEAWCSPASLSMVMSYWAKETGDRGLDEPVPTVADGVYDHSYKAWGNWSFNTAYAAAHGLEARVGRLASLAEAAGWVAAGVPLVVSVAWDDGEPGQELSGAPLARSNGHLLVIRGFTPSGNVLVNDPAARDDAGVPRIYERGEFSRAWLRNRGASGGIAYLVHPPGWETPGASVSRRNP